MPLFALGSAAYILNVLPFAYFAFFALVPKRYSVIGLGMPSNTRDYYKRWYVKMFFGRFQYTMYLFVAAYYAGAMFGLHRKYGIDEFTSFYHEFDLYDVEASAQKKRSIDRYLYNKKLGDSRNVVLKERAEKDRDLKIKAFDSYALQYNL
jgi:hypothetical protein